MSRVVITVSYGDYTHGTGGTDKFILSQQKYLNTQGIDCIHFHPYNNLLWNVLVNGKFFGIVSNNRAKYILYKTKKVTAIFIHHLKGVNFDLLEGILDYCDVPIFYYLHDYYTICPISGLIREDGSFCGGGFPSDNKCVGCSYSDEAVELSKKAQLLIKKHSNRITFVAPSEAAKGVWLKDYPEYKTQVKVIYHQNLLEEYSDNNTLLSENESLKIAFVGYQKPLKGWKQFLDATANANKLGVNEQFYQFGWGEEQFPYIEQVDVDFKINITAMTDALRSKKIHIAVLWSLWPETYAYTYYEALAANCFVITNENSGNICDQVKSRKNGIIVDNLSEILCDENSLRKLVNDFRKDGHITPNILQENEEFLSLISDIDWKPQKVRQVLDLSCVLSMLKKSKKMVKDWIK